MTETRRAGAALPARQHSPDLLLPNRFTMSLTASSKVIENGADGGRGIASISVTFCDPDWLELDRWNTPQAISSPVIRPSSQTAANPSQSEYALLWIPDHPYVGTTNVTGPKADGDTVASTPLVVSVREMSE